MQKGLPSRIFIANAYIFFCSRSYGVDILCQIIGEHLEGKLWLIYPEMAPF